MFLVLCHLMYIERVKKPNLIFEKKYWALGKQCVCGLDEVGRGCWAGPLYVGAVIFPQNAKMIEGVRDSKLLSASVRIRLSDQIKKSALAVGIGFVTPLEIDDLGLTLGTLLAMERAIIKMKPEPDFFLTDSVKFEKYNHLSILHGDEISYSIAAASILAKVERDQYMANHPLAEYYQFQKNKGYGTKEHRQMIEQYGVSEIHRKSFRPILERT